MPKKKTVKVEPKFEEEVIPTGSGLPEPTSEFLGEHENELAEKVLDVLSNTKRSGFVAFAAFDLDGTHYEAGDPFILPAGLRRDLDHDTFRGIAKRGQTDPGLSFAKDDDRRYILPVKEM